MDRRPAHPRYHRLRRGGWSAGALGLSVLALGAGCSDTAPSLVFAKPGGTLIYGCNSSEALTISYSRDGRTASLSEAGRTLDLRFVEARGTQEVFAAEGYVLTLDPKALLVKPDGTLIGPCEGAP